MLYLTAFLHDPPFENFITPQMVFSLSKVNEGDSVRSGKCGGSLSSLGRLA